MRSFGPIRAFLTLILTAFAIGCGTDGAEYVCGDGACETENGEDEDICSEDCGRKACGDGVCGMDETLESCHFDRQQTLCRGDFPVDCRDGSGCWSPDTDCRSNYFPCGLGGRCESLDAWAYCCGDRFSECPEDVPHLCPEDGSCHRTPESVPSHCSVASCTVTLGDC